MIYRFHSDGKTSIHDILKRAGHLLPADCGGRGICGRCMVRFMENAPEPSEYDLKCLGSDEISQGYRLACKTFVNGDFTISFELSEENIAAESLGANEHTVSAADISDLSDVSLAVDIGTTTIAAAAVRDGAVLRTATSVNHQRTFGADVLSRIVASNEGHGSQLKEIVESDIRNLADRLGIGNRPVQTVISANTTMQHLLAGYSCETLGVVPFTPVDISLHEKDGYTFLPGISTYVGADIVSGIVNMGIDQSEKICAFLDLGTNGEMAIGCADRILCTSTAAGPAFEGVNISCGVAGIPGAISHVEINDGSISYETIDGQQPVGICGSGVIDLTYELLKEELIDETGALDEEYIDDGFNICDGVSFSEKDVREVQLAKSAVRAGLETLIDAYGVTYDDIDKLYIAGGFGQKIDLEKCAGIGLLPQELIGKAEAVGNTSLKGAVQFVADPSSRERFLRVPEKSEEISLAESRVFQDLFIEYMYF